jgi:ATP-dependent exoDNAse (exonuclease V) alpha subunit
VVDAWQHDGGNVIGLTVSQAAAQVLATEAQVRAENTTKWLHETRHRRWRLPDRPLLLIDEASMVATAELVTLVTQTRQACGKVLLVGDPAQLSAIHIGGAFDLLAERHGAAQLTEIRRFTHEWEATASVLLRQRDPAAIDAYAMRGRIHAGRLNELETDLFDAWQADALGTPHHGNRETVLMVVSTNEQAAVLGQRARHALIAAGQVHDGPTVTLADNVASVGDHIVTRRKCWEGAEGSRPTCGLDVLGELSEPPVQLSGDAVGVLVHWPAHAAMTVGNQNLTRPATHLDR